ISVACCAFMLVSVEARLNARETQQSQQPQQPLATQAQQAEQPQQPPSQQAQQPRQAQRPQRTEAEARQTVQRLRDERQKQRQQTGAPVELISSYIKANIGPVPASLGVSPFYTKYADALGIPVLASEKTPDDALLVARDIVNTMLAARP